MAKPWVVKVVLVTTYEPSPETGWRRGDPMGELREWIEHEHLEQRVPFPAGTRDLRTNQAHDVVGLVTGIGLVNATAAVMALGQDPRFDLTHAYWLLNGLAGVDPLQGTIGTPAWASFVVGDVARQIDSREAPAAWPYGQFALGTSAPEQVPAHPLVDNSYALNAALAHWAFGLTQNLKLADNEAMQQTRAQWQPLAQTFPAAVAPPAVIQGDVYSSDAYWHGTILTGQARAWVRQWTRGDGTFAMTAMEDAGVAEALRRLGRMQRADASRLMVLRVGSNFCRQQPGHTALDSVTAPFVRSTALENVWLVGSTVVHALVNEWAKYGPRTPGSS